jgi:thiosulfate reductase cytochrome b subunit
MTQGTLRTIVRTIHLVVAIPIYGYIFSPFEKLPDYAPKTRYIFFPLMVLTGLWMWKGHVVLRLFSKRPTGQESAG